MIYTNKEKQIAEDFLNCKIPSAIKDNEYALKNDSMEYYEALFDFAHCIVDDHILMSAFAKILEDSEFECFLKKIKVNEHHFYDKIKNLLVVINKHK